jgi:hypothetical protein
MTDQTIDTSQVLGMNFNQPLINIGSHPDNDIVLRGEGVEPFHAVLKVSVNAFQFVLLSPQADLAIDGKVYTESPVDVNEFNRIGIGGHEIMFQNHGLEGGIRVFVSDMGADRPIERYLVDEDQDPIVVETPTPSLETFVDETAVFELEVVNGGPVVASFYFRVEGIPEEWVEFDPPTIKLNESDRRIIYLRVTPPRHYSSYAGENSFKVIVSSSTYYGHKVEIPLNLVIEPFYDFTLGNLSPRQKRIPFRKSSETVFLPVTNESNHPASFNISTFDEENGCSFEYVLSDELSVTRQAIVPLEPGEVLNLPIVIRPHRKSIFAMASRQYFYSTTVQVQEQTIQPQMISGTAIAPPMFGWWTLLATFWILIISAFIILQPRILNFAVASGEDVIELGSSTRLEWEVSPFASRLGITDLDVQIERGQTSLTVAPRSSTTYELVSGNWLSGLFGMDYTRKVTVLVVPPSPRIGVFEVDRLEVDKGKPVRIRWSATRVDELILTVDEVVYPLSPEEFSGEQDYILEDDAIITLEAKNASGSELRSYFVDVVPPNIDVVDFTVWVRPAAAANAPYQPRLGTDANHIIQAQVPDPNFPEKLVSLVPDIGNDLGYRVEIYQPDRELSKGEQVMLEWSVNGVDNLEIAPFNDVLPKEGVQPFFPQESMNFIMKAKSGELEQIFMLPVKVYDGLPPVAPTIEFFKASPTSMLGAGEVEFAWSVSGEWTNVQISGSEGILQDGLLAQGFATLTVEESSTFILTAFNNDLSSAASVEITVNPDLIPVDIRILDAYPSGLFQIGGRTLVTVDFFDLPDDQPDPTGQVIVTDGTASCTVALPAKSCSLTFSTPGVKTLTANYLGDAIFLQSDSDPFPPAGSNITLEVQSATVVMVPSYDYLDTRQPVRDIAATTLSSDQGLFITVEVQPSLSLPDDNKSKVNLQICDDDGFGQPVKTTCVLLGGDTIEIATAPTATGRIQGYGYAEIVIQKFPSAGEKVFVFNYSHDDNSFEPAQEIQGGITINRTGIYLELPICDSPSSPFSGCEIGLLESAGSPATAELVFDILKSADNSQLPSLLTSPDPDLFILTPDVGTAWTCSTRRVGGYWKLACSGQFADFGSGVNAPELTITHAGGDPNYTVTVPAAFNIDVKQKVTIEIATVNVPVGREIILTGSGGILIFKNGTVVIPSTNIDGPLTLEVSSGDATALKVASTSNCALVDGKVEIASVGASCVIYFSKAGSFRILATYHGNDEFAGSIPTDGPVTITKELDVNANWTIPAQVAVNVPSTVTIVLQVQGQANPSALTPPLNPAVFDGKQLSIGLTGGGNSCSILADETSPTENLADITIDNTGVLPVIKADFQFICYTQPLDIVLTAAFSAADTANFAISSDASAPTTVRNFPNVQLKFKISTDSLGNNVVFGFGDETNYNALYSTTPLKLNAGVEYYFSFQSEPYDVYYYTFLPGFDYTQNYINTVMNSSLITLSLPQVLSDAIDTAKSSCNLAAGTPNVKFKDSTVLSNTNFSNFWGFKRFQLTSRPIECKLVFKNLVDLTTEQTTFDFNSSGNYSYFFTDGLWSIYYNFPYSYTDAIMIVGPEIAKQQVTIDMAQLPGTGTVGTPFAVTINVTENTPSGLNPVNFSTNTAANFDTQFSIVATPNCVTIDNKQLINGNQASFTVTSNNGDTCNDVDIRVTYTGNANYESANKEENLAFNKNTATYNAANTNSTPALTGNLSTGATRAISIRVDPTTPTNPTGLVWVWVENTGGTKMTGGGTDYTISACTGSCSYNSTNKRYEINLSSRDADFTFTVNAMAIASGYTLKYQYRGDTVFNPITPVAQFGPFSIVAPPPP